VTSRAAVVYAHTNETIDVITSKHAMYTGHSPFPDCPVPVIYTFSPADGRGSAVPAARKVTGYIRLCCKLCRM